MKHLLITTIAAVVLVGCGTTQSQEKTPKVEPPSISIHKAASKGDIEAVRQHLAAGTDPNLRSPDVTPLFAASYKIMAAASYEVMTLLVENGADVNDIGWGMTALHKLTDPESVMYLVDKVADVNAIDKFGDTPLHKVVEGYLYRREKSVGILIAAGAEVNAINFAGLTPLDSLLSKSHYSKSNKVKLELLGLLRKHGAKTSLELRPLDKKEDDENNSGLDILLMDWIFD